MDSGQRDVARSIGNGMNATTKLVLAEDVIVAPVANLPPELSRSVAHGRSYHRAVRVDLHRRQVSTVGVPGA
jgi:hypothetical protein